MDAFVGKAPDQALSFTNAHIISYFVSRTAVDGMPVCDFKAINKSSLNLFNCGHVQDINVLFEEKFCIIQANCLPEMQKDCTYKLLLYLELNTFDIVGAECGCPAGKGPSASCKHIGALCYGLEEFSHFGHLPDFLTCTDQLQQWNCPRLKKLDPIPVSHLNSRRAEIQKQASKSVLLVNLIHANLNIEKIPLMIWKTCTVIY